MKYDLNTAIATVKLFNPSLNNYEIGKKLKEVGLCHEISPSNKINKDVELATELIDIEARHAQESAESGFLGHEIRTSTLKQVKEKQEEAQEQEKTLLLTQFEENQVDKSIDNLRKTIAQSKEQPPPTVPTPRVFQLYQMCVNNMLAPEPEKVPRSGRGKAK